MTHSPLRHPAPSCFPETREQVVPGAHETGDVSGPRRESEGNGLLDGELRDRGEPVVVAELFRQGGVETPDDRGQAGPLPRVHQEGATPSNGMPLDLRPNSTHQGLKEEPSSDGKCGESHCRGRGHLNQR